MDFENHSALKLRHAKNDRFDSHKPTFSLLCECGHVPPQTYQRDGKRQEVVMVSANERFLTQRQRYQPVTLPQDFSDEEMARGWTLTTSDQQEIGRYHP